MPSLRDVEAARAIVDRYLPRAPIERSPYLSQLLGAEVLLKIETFKPTRTFKVRGALNKIASPTPSRYQSAPIKNAQVLTPLAAYLCSSLAKTSLG